MFKSGTDRETYPHLSRQELGQIFVNNLSHEKGSAFETNPSAAHYKAVSPFINRTERWKDAHIEQRKAAAKPGPGAYVSNIVYRPKKGNAFGAEAKDF